MSDAVPSTPPAAPWLVRVPLVFTGLTTGLFKRLGVTSSKKLGQDYHLIQLPSPEALQTPEAALLVRWNLPVQHSWPCHPRDLQGFVEKAAQALVAKFSAMHPQSVLIGPLHPDPAHRYYRSLSSNLRGRVLQIFPAMSAPTHEAEAQDRDAPTLFCLVGREGLYAGVQSPKLCGGFYPGGTKFISQSSPASISRAGAKVAEALHHLLLHRPALPKGSHWLELGASPGGMTSELLAREYQVTAVDRAPLDARLRNAPGLTFHCADVATFRPGDGVKFDAILCDLNGDSVGSMNQVLRLAKHLKRGGIVIFTLKMPGVQTLPEMVALSRSVVGTAADAGLSLLAQTHLSYNRHEFTLFFEQK